MRVEREMVKKISSPKGLAGWLFICIKCKKHFRSSIRAIAHAKNCGSKMFRRRRKSIRKMSCNFCGHEECTVAALTSHRIRHHSHSISKFRCTRCNRQFVSFKSYKRHVARHGSSQVFTCSFSGCGKKYKTKANMMRHKRDKHLGRTWPSVAGITPLPGSGSEVNDSLTSLSQSSASLSPSLSDAHSVPEDGFDLTPSSKFIGVSGLSLMENIRNVNVRAYSEGFLTIFSEMSERRLRNACRIFESRIIQPNQPTTLTPRSRSTSTALNFSSPSPPPSSSPVSNQGVLDCGSLTAIPPAGSPASTSSTSVLTSPTAGQIVEMDESLTVETCSEVR